MSHAGILGNEFPKIALHRTAACWGGSLIYSCLGEVKSLKSVNCSFSYSSGCKVPYATNILLSKHQNILYD